MLKEGNFSHWNYGFDDMTKLEVGDQLWESCQYGNLFIEVVEAPVVENEKVAFKAKVLRSQGSARNGEIVDYGSTKGLEHYGPKLYNECQYVHGIDEDGNFKFFRSE